MAEFDPHETIDDAIDAVARGLVKRARDGMQEVEYFSPEELAHALQSQAAITASTKKHFGIRMVKLSPPGCG